VLKGFQAATARTPIDEHSGSNQGLNLGHKRAWLGLLICTAPLGAHHSFDAEYDRSKTEVLSGIVTRVEWMNPHVRFYIDAADAEGNVTNWNLELGSPASLTRRGWTRKSLAVGDRVSVVSSLAKDGSKMANARKVTLADGRTVFGASSADPE
jgi:hypothetical protein